MEQNLETTEKFFFYEKQYFIKKWSFLIYILISIFIFICYKTFQSPNGETVIALVIVCLACGIVLFLITTLCLYTEIDNNVIKYKFPPINPDWNRIKWSDIANISIVKCNPLFKFGGWGIRSSSNGINSYIVSGDTVLKIELISGYVIIIGTDKQNEDKLNRIIRSMMNDNKNCSA